MRRIFLVLCCTIIAVQYSDFLPYVETKKPFIYRALIPLFSDLLSTREWSVFFGISLSVAMLYAYEKYWKQTRKNDVLFVLCFSLVTLVLLKDAKYYDYPSAFFMFVILLLWMNGKYAVTVPIFFLASINRETTIFMLPALFIIKRDWRILLHVAAYFVSRYLLSHVFGSDVGLYIRPLENAIIHAYLWKATTVLVLLFSLTILLSIKNIPFTPKGFVVYIATVLPIISVAYFVSGWAFEIRVFAEVVPMLFMSAFLRN